MWQFSQLNPYINVEYILIMPIIHTHTHTHAHINIYSYIDDGHSALLSFLFTIRPGYVYRNNGHREKCREPFSAILYSTRYWKDLISGSASVEFVGYMTRKRSIHHPFLSLPRENHLKAGWTNELNERKLYRSRGRTMHHVDRSKFIAVK